ncbi:hypothetical protein pb186bvf_008856 [Paramecium bursaria]
MEFFFIKKQQKCFAAQEKEKNSNNNLNLSKQNDNYLNLQQQQEYQFSLDINDEACIIKDINHIQKFNTLGSSRQHIDPATQSRSNSRGTRSSERLTQNLPNITCRKTPFLNFKHKKQHQNSKYLATKMGYTIYVTKVTE